MQIHIYPGETMNDSARSINKSKSSNDTEIQTVEVLFNSACPVCRAGIEYQKVQSNEFRVRWTDVHLDNKAVGSLKLEQVRKYLHVKDHLGQLHIGLDAFILIWRQSPKHRFLALFFSVPLVKWVGRQLYILFANILYSWNRLMKNW